MLVARLTDALVYLTLIGLYSSRAQLGRSRLYITRYVHLSTLGPVLLQQLDTDQPMGWIDRNFETWYIFNNHCFSIIIPGTAALFLH